MSFELDHVAIPSHDIAVSVRWYQDHYGAQVLYQDSTWAFLKIGQGKLALVTPSEHPPHVALRVTASQLQAAAHQEQKPIDDHRDGTRGIYVSDPDGNVLELICYPLESAAEPSDS